MEANKYSWKNQPMPSQCINTEFVKEISTEEFNTLKRGLIPSEMEDKWFIYSEDNSIFFHRSWTGICIYQAGYQQLENDKFIINELSINRDPNQYSEDDTEYERLFEYLIDRLVLGKNVEFPIKSSDVSDEDKMLIKHSTVGYGISRKKV